jgi:hypothetical protein
LFRLPPLLALTSVLLLALPAWGEPPNPDLARASLLLEELRYAEASKALEAARARPGNDRDTLLRILELQGVVAAMLQQPSRARAAFQTLAVLAPDHQLMGDYAPRVVTPFFEAKGWVADQAAELRFEAAATKTENFIEGLSVQVQKDVLKLTRAVRFHLRPDRAAWRAEAVPLAEGKASLTVKGERVQWWAELLDERQAVLALVGSDTAPLNELSPRLEALTRAPKVPTVTSESPFGPPMRIASYALMGVAVGTGAMGGYFGLRARGARSQVEGATVDDRGLTTGLTQREALELDQRARSSARLANILFGVAGATAIAGGTLWVLGKPVTVAATPVGVTVGGELP